MISPGAVYNQLPKMLRHGAALVGAIAAMGSFASAAEAKYNPDQTNFPTPIGAQTLAMISVTFEGQAPLPFGNDVIEEQTFAAPDSVADYYKKASFAQFTISGETFGPVMLSAKLLDKHCTEDSLV